MDKFSVSVEYALQNVAKFREKLLDLLNNDVSFAFSK